MAVNAELLRIAGPRTRQVRWPVALVVATLLVAGCGGTEEAGESTSTDASSGICTDDGADDAADGPTTTWEVQPDASTSTSSTSSTPASSTEPGSTGTTRPSSTTTATSATSTTTRPTTTRSTTTTAPTTTRSTTTAATVTPARVVYRGSQSRAAVALTFDAGADCGFAVQILDTLATEGISATFGMTGRWAEANPGLVRRMVDEGHQLLNHTYDHPSFTGASTGTPALTAAERRSQLDRADAAVSAITGRSMQPWFRPPYGDIDDSVNIDLAAAGYRYDVLWTVDSLGWTGIPADDIEDRCLDRAGNGVIFLFHVGSQSQDAEALPGIIDGLRALGYSFDTVADIL
jgi:peptidoglycan-N-acetylglucosamine deacetylase